MPCETWRALLDRCLEAQQKLQQALEVSSSVGDIELARAAHVAETARKYAEDCEAELTAHEQDHNCLSWTGMAKAS